ncbi:MAG: 4Fe-4S binding protein [Chloroflexi bacterium]|nr:4Fe-4S binding protein [Chloroflexota bacterium]
MAFFNDGSGELDQRLMSVPVAIMLVCWTVGLVYWWTTHDFSGWFFLAYIGMFIGVGVGSFIGLPQNKRPVARRFMMLMVGSMLLGLALITDHGNMQIEGLFFGVLAGAPWIILHYALAKFAGPLVFGRIWCGWACWFGMVFDLLPYKASRYRIPGRWGALRYAHFFLSLVTVAILWFAFGYRDGATGSSGFVWFLAGLALYYLLGIGMALAIKDNRAFCKYLCPISVPLKTFSRYAILKIAGDAPKCDSCNVCIEQCPMNIRVPDYILKGERVLSTECTLCQTCIHVCPHDALKLSFAFDVGGKELIDFVPPRGARGNGSAKQEQVDKAAP